MVLKTRRSDRDALLTLHVSDFRENHEIREIYCQKNILFFGSFLPVSTDWKPDHFEDTFQPLKVRFAIRSHR